MNQFDTKMTALADAIKAKNSNAAAKLSIDEMIDAVNEIEQGGSDIQFGYINADGQFQELDLSGDTPVDSGDPITVDAVSFNTGKESPEYGGGGGSMELYRCASVVQPKVPVGFTVNHPDTDWGSAYKDEYLPVDRNRTGANRLWVRKNDLPYINDEYASFEAVGYDGSKWLIGTTYGVNEHPSTSECTAISNCTNANATMAEIASATWDWSVSGGDAYSDRFNITEEWGAITSWNGYKCTYDAESGELTQDATLTEGLSCDGFVPRIGRVYSIDSKLQATLSSDPAGVGFYHCTEGASVPSTIVISGAGTANANGVYVRKPISFNADNTNNMLACWYKQGDTPCIIRMYNDNSNYVRLLSGYLTDDDKLYANSVLYYSRKHVETIEEGLQVIAEGNWSKSSGAEPVPTGAYTPASGTWKGYRLIQNSDGTWSKDDAETDNLTVGGSEPLIGNIYNEDATVAISSAMGLE